MYRQETKQVALIIRHDSSVAITVSYFNSYREMEDWLQKQSFEVLSCRPIDTNVYYLIIEDRPFSE